MAKAKVTGHRSRPMKAVIFEPRQSPEQEEVILDEVLLRPMEERELDLRSATAGYRLEDVSVEEAKKLGFDPDNPDRDLDDAEARAAATTPDQEGEVTEPTQAEIDAGKKRLQAHRSGKSDAPAARAAVREEKAREETEEKTATKSRSKK